MVDYALMLACDLPLVNVFKLGSLSPGLDHKPLYLELAIPHFTKRCHRTPGHLKQVICRILRTLRQKMTQNRSIHKKGCRMRKGF